MKYCVIGDLHGNHTAFRALLRKVDAIDADGMKRLGVYIVQVGDIINGVPDSIENDHKALKMLIRYADVHIYGNHDLWWAKQHPAGMFGGMDNMAHLQHLKERAKLIKSGQSTVATAIGGYLITHAGLHAAYSHMIDLSSAEAAAARICELWAAQPMLTVFRDVGPARGGEATQGGLFWCDWQELINNPAPVRQIVGHTPQPNGPIYFDGYGAKTDRGIWSVDIGAKVGPRAACLVKEDDGDWTPVRLDEAEDVRELPEFRAAMEQRARMETEGQW